MINIMSPSVAGSHPAFHMFLQVLLHWTVAAIYFSPTSGKLYTSPDQLPKTTYDYIVIGAGAAGAVVSARLSENPNISVLVVEAGISNEGVIPSIIPALGPFLTPGTIYDWNHTTTDIPGLNGRSIPYPQGKMLGGSTSVNYMIYNRGSSEDFDRYADVTEDQGWNWGNMQKYAFKNEKLSTPADQHNTTGQLLPWLHSANGTVSVTLGGFPTPLDSRVMSTTTELSSEFPFNPDMIGGDVLGVGWSYASIGNGTRSSSATAYLKPSMERSNPDVVINAQATKLLPTGFSMGVPSFRAVQVAQCEEGPVHTLTAHKEIVLSAGTFGTPALLQLSGIGDEEELRAAGVPTIVNNPSVGHNMSDHAFLPNPYLVNSNDTFDSLLRYPDILEANTAQWINTQTGPLAAGLCNHLGWFRLPNNATIFETTEDPAAGPNSSHYEMVFANAWYVPGVPLPPTGNFMSITIALVSPTSRGSIKITSPNAFDNPAINPNFLSTDFDFLTLVEAVKASRRFLSASAWKDYVIGAYGDLANANSDDEIVKYVRNNAGTVFHATGTASMSPIGAPWGVVDPDLKVKGVNGLRIVDGSVIPLSPNAHTQGPIYLIAERAADLIKGDHV